MNDSNRDQMTCSCFEQRLQSLLDQRVDPQSDTHLLAHAQFCPSCSNALMTWSRVQSLYTKPDVTTECDTPVISPRRRSESRVVATLTAVAAAIALLIIAVRPSTTPQQTAAVVTSRPQSSETNTVPPPTAATSTIVSSIDSQHGPSTPDADQALLARQWIESMQGRDWMAETMPAVQSVGQGVAPLGRSLMQAVTILTQSTRNQTS
ncbi:anti-sigma factor [Stieleria varia]|uniref:Zinc-finger domain-containing protein n=1 Tax=Stieleria varia TaxID=2528005 RepID=A0A5C6AM02_9BACT|nr:hypothetical protein [Stieleria varia]TWU01083.1 hypothetical protein Pla52n_44540 [Stieleria varia]